MLLLLTGLAVAEAPADFAFGVPLETSGPQALFQVELPPAVYEGVVRADLADLRVFNAAGEPVPHAFLPRPVAVHEKQPPCRCRSLPCAATPAAVSRGSKSASNGRRGGRW
jgi:hypothetical protein